MKKRENKIACLLLAGMLSCSLLAGCGNSSSGSEEKSSSETTQESGSETTEESSSDVTEESSSEATGDSEAAAAETTVEEQVLLDNDWAKITLEGYADCQVLDDEMYLKVEYKHADQTNMAIQINAKINGVMEQFKSISLHDDSGITEKYELMTIPTRQMSALGMNHVGEIEFSFSGGTLFGFYIQDEFFNTKTEPVVVKTSAYEKMETEIDESLLTEVYNQDGLRVLAAYIPAIDFSLVDEDVQMIKKLENYVDAADRCKDDGFKSYILGYFDNTSDNQELYLIVDSDKMPHDSDKMLILGGTYGKTFAVESLRLLEEPTEEINYAFKIFEMNDTNYQQQEIVAFDGVIPVKK